MCFAYLRLHHRWFYQWFSHPIHIQNFVQDSLLYWHYAVFLHHLESCLLRGYTLINLRHTLQAAFAPTSPTSWYIYIYNWCDNFSKSPSLMFFFLNLGWFTVLQAGSIVTSPCRYTYMYIQSSPTGSGWHGFLSLRPKVREAAALQTTATPTCPDTLETWDEYDRLDMDPWFWEDDLKWILYDSVYKQPISSPWCNENISERFDDLKSDTSLKCLSGVADCQIVRLSEPWLFCWIFADAAFWGSVGRLKHKHGFPPTIWWVWGECFSGLTV